VSATLVIQHGKGMRRNYLATCNLSGSTAFLTLCLKKKAWFSGKRYWT